MNNQGYYRFWSLDLVYAGIVNLVQDKGVPCPRSDLLHRDTRLFEGDVYDFGKVNGRDYPKGSAVLFPDLLGRSEKPTTSFPATLIITCESQRRLEKLEKRFGLDSVPDERREPVHPEMLWIKEIEVA
ncbi:MAG: hypothetical protein KJ879_03815 [Nanoarchaeota archaeon]|nr:hypothetical protein [Nanoarchaeota archaeon]